MTDAAPPPPATDAAARIAAAVAALQVQRAQLGDAAVDLAVAALQHAGRAPPPQLKQVSVLFAGLADTTGARRADAVARCAAAVQAERGVVLQVDDHGLLAVFGAPVAHEDDAERAVLAGLALLALPGAPVLRTGVHTGGVLLGAGVDGDGSIRGLAVNLAARMEQTAPPGALRISQDTWRQVRGRFDMQAQPPLVVKGHDAPLATWLVQAPRALPDGLAGRGVAGVATPLVGRALPLARLQQAYTTLCMAHGLQCVLVLGDAGLGKSRLVAELRQWAAQQARGARWLQALASAQRTQQPYAMLRALLGGALGLRDSDTPAAARRAWLDALLPVAPMQPGDAAVLGQLLGLDFGDDPEVRSLRGDARQLRDRAFFAASQWLRALAAGGPPLVAVFDDLHWADDGTLDFIDHLLARHSDLPLLVLGLTRPTLAERGRMLPRSTLQVHLQPLDGDDAAALADALLARLDTLPPALRTLLAERAEGNPFHMEELVNMLADRGVLDTTALPWRYRPERLQDLGVPATLVGVLQARLDALPAPARHTAQLASVVGPRFWDSSLAALGLAPPQVQQALQTLHDRGIVQPQQPGTLAGLQEWTFCHHTLHQVAYAGVLRRTRRSVHAQVAQWLLGLPGGAPPDQVAEHLERGEQPLLAGPHWQRAAEQAAALYAHAPALAHAARAQALTPAHALDRHYALTLLRCRVLEVQSERTALDTALAALHALAQQLADPARQSEALALRARYCLDGGAMQQAEAAARTAVACAPADDPSASARAHALLGQSLARLGRHDEAAAATALALDLARRAGATAHEGMILNDMGMLADEQGDHGAAMVLYAQALDCHRAIGHRNNEGGTLSNLGYAAMMLGDYTTASARFEQAHAIFTAIGQRQNAAITVVNLGIARLNQGRPADALAHARAAARQLRATGDRWAEGAALRVLGQAALALGDLAAAQRHLRAAAALFRALELPHLALEAVAALAEEASARGDLAGALAHVDAVLSAQAAGVPLDGTEEPMRLLLACWRVLQAAGDARAAPLLETAHAELQQRAARIGDAARRRAYLHDVPHHRALVAAWQQFRTAC
ncbi:ATP-binding protein [Rubrivivax sp. RP6-9]|uniref:ATP-binding protein n=1 Tax=Rubrivivax sp. RP6-9 TaxID=3415750 RepID=UPI003CC5B33B